MNKARRALLQKIIDDLEAIKERIDLLREEEQDYADNMPENMQGAEKHEKAEEVASSLEETCDDIDTAIEKIQEAIQ